MNQLTAFASADNDAPYRRLLQRSLVALAVTAAAVTGCYFFVDRPVAYFVHDHDFARFDVLRWLTLPEPVVQLWSPLVLAILAVRRAWGPFRYGERVLLTACIALVLSDQFTNSVRGPFGRLWPDTWIDQNPSLIHDGAFGFYPFHGGRGYASFPSGHTTRAVAVAAVLWVSYRRARWLWATAALVLAASLVGMNYHFVSDVVAGACVGGIVGTYSAHFGALGAPGRG